jgi:hypothetical protein
VSPFDDSSELLVHNLSRNPQYAPIGPVCVASIANLHDRERERISGGTICVLTRSYAGDNLGWSRSAVSSARFLSAIAVAEPPRNQELPEDEQQVGTGSSRTVAVRTHNSPEPHTSAWAAARKAGKVLHRQPRGTGVHESATIGARVPHAIYEPARRGLESTSHQSS